MERLIFLLQLMQKRLNLSGDEVDFTDNTATLTDTITITVAPDAEPIIVNASDAVDETGLNDAANLSETATGTVNVDYQGEGPGTLTATDAATFAFAGSVAGAALTSEGGACNS